MEKICKNCSKKNTCGIYSHMIEYSRACDDFVPVPPTFNDQLWACMLPGLNTQTEVAIMTCD